MIQCYHQQGHSAANQHQIQSLERTHHQADQSAAEDQTDSHQEELLQGHSDEYLLRTQEELPRTQEESHEVPGALPQKHSSHFLKNRLLF